ncbi:PCI-domain-containing protein [Cylindrobasidium torrendii FP15055 ss-10]|uniref:PCI-domain-containing protein n=1 Tax=Cylindrobasidium torrendii FP15055 ss-10 TaxID=1314674 RepID=A0A0D7BGF7_9AGAR|nr:PCI-domain-containing protein [Cylindrobasidium torrendii FP15055 ss-10]
MSEEVVLPIPNLSVPQYVFILSSPSLSHLHAESQKELIEAITKDEMTPYYTSISALLPSDPVLLEKLQEQNKKSLDAIDEKLKKAEEMEGETEISDALRERANFLTKIGEKEKATEAQKLALEKTPGLGSRIDIALTLVRIGLFWLDRELIGWGLEKAETLINEGGDWDRRNRLKVYKGLHLLSIRQFSRASGLLLDAISTFTATELLSYNDFVALTVISSALTLSRVDLKKKLISSPEVISVLPDIPTLGELVSSLYECHYDKFFRALATLEQTHLIPSRFLNPHARFYTREMRVLAYKQLLQSYKSLTLDSMATAFGVRADFVDNELARFISSGRLNASIDRVNRIVETSRDSDNPTLGLKASAADVVIKQGDLVLASAGRLSRVLG